VLKVGRLGFNFLAESDQKTLKVGIHSMSVGIGGREKPDPLDFHRWYTVKVEGGLMVLFFGLIFLVSPLPLKIILPMPLIHNFPA